MKVKSRMWIAVALMLVVGVAAGMIVGANAAETGKNGTFNGSPAHVDGNGNLYIDEINFPDEEFRTVIIDPDEETLADFEDLTGEEMAPIDENGDHLISVAEAAKVTSIDIASGYMTDGVKDISGIEFFISLEKLYCGNADIKAIDVSKNTNLKILLCDYSNIESLDLSKNTKLEELYADFCELKALDVSNNGALKILYCRYNSIKTLKIPNSKVLTTIACNDNCITYLTFEPRAYTDMVGYDVTAQTYDGEIKVYHKDGKYIVSLSELDEAFDADLPLVSIVSGDKKAALDFDKGLATFDSKVDEFVVNVGVKFSDAKAATMDVTEKAKTVEYDPSMGELGNPAEPAVTEPTATEPAATEPAATELAATEPTATEPAATEPAPAETDGNTEPSPGGDISMAVVYTLIFVMTASAAVVTVGIASSKRRSR